MLLHLTEKINVFFCQTNLENTQQEWLEKEIEFEKKVTETEDRLAKLKVRVLSQMIHLCWWFSFLHDV